ncbi:hypothetical protein DPMN_050111 [Dreissena polymorpha]|uniref:Uncharacterized protein n=1 Tax=Dreissena polymorpha TaxID=45954 RepID=A0A9D4CH68_DREPO|nr:hypothetical protein DPMN_050111 [Dreissena polymorpha]
MKYQTQISTSVLTERHVTTTLTVPTLTGALSANVRPDTETWMGSVDNTVMVRHLSSA